MNIRDKIKLFIKKLNVKEKISVASVVGLENLLCGKTALIIGGNSGIGFKIAEKIVLSGGNVIISGSDEEKINSCCEIIGRDKAMGIAIDLRKINSFEKKINQCIELFPDHKIDILVNSGGFNPKKHFFNTSEYDFDNTMSINVKGVFFMCQKISSYMINNGIKGHILNISSSSALRPAWSPYEISKWSIRGMTVGLADTLLPYGIVVNAIAPGPTATPMLGKNVNDDLDLPYSPIGRYITTEEIANLAIMLLSDVGNIVIGDTLYATGGSGVISLHR